MGNPRTATAKDIENRLGELKDNIMSLGKPAEKEKHGTLVRKITEEIKNLAKAVEEIQGKERAKMEKNLEQLKGAFEEMKKNINMKEGKIFKVHDLTDDKKKELIQKHGPKTERASIIMAKINKLEEQIKQEPKEGTLISKLRKDELVELPEIEERPNKPPKIG